MSPEKKFFNMRNVFAGVVLILLLIASFLTPITPYASQKNNTNNTQEYNDNSNQELISKNPFEEITIVGKSAFVWDVVKQKPLFEKDSDKVMPLASIAKTLSAVVSLELAPQNTEIRIEKEFLEAEGDSGLYVNERWALKDLIDFSLVVSSNDGFRAIASVIGAITFGTDDFYFGRQKFIEKVNQKAKNIGLEKTVIHDEAGLDQNENQSGAYSTAKETALLFEYILKNKPEILEATTKKETSFFSLNQINHTASNTNLIVKNVPGIIGAKTGFTDLAGGNLATVFDAGLGRPIIIVVLNSTINERFVDSEKLIEASRSFIIDEKKNAKYLKI